MLTLAIALALSTAPLAADTAPRWTQVSVGQDHACALDGDGRAFCWGNNRSGQLGARTPETCGIMGESGHRGCWLSASDTPVAVAGGTRFASISAGTERTCALDGSGEAYCWGMGVRDHSGACADGYVCARPVAYETGHRFRTLTVSPRQICGVTTGAQALCTNLLPGANWGALGEMRPLGPGLRARAVAAVGEYALHNECVVDERGAAWCRGTNRTAQLGTGAPAVDPNEDTDTLTRVAGNVDFRQLVVMEGWICGLDAGGQVWCWGRRSSYDYYRPGEKAPGSCGAVACVNAPVRAVRELRFREISAHLGRVCGLTATDEAFCWAPTSAPASATDAWADYVASTERPDMRLVTLAGATEVGEGSCGIRTDGALFCWGAANRPERRQIVHPAAAER